MIEFTIHTKLYTCNEYILFCRSNKFLGAKIKKDTENKIVYEIKNQKIKNSIKNPPIIITFKWIEKTRRRDKDNIAFSKKFILDAMQKAKIIENDNNNYILGFKDLFFYDKKIESNYVKIEIEEMKCK